MRNCSDLFRWVPAAAVLAAASCGAAGSPAAPGHVAAAPPRQVVVLGDSLAVSPSRSVNFAAELGERLEASGGRWSVRNAGVSGDTTSGGVRRIDEALTPETGILVLALGANDGLRGVDIAVVERNLSTMIERAQGRGVKVLLCGMETPPMNGWDYTIAFHRVFPRVAAKYNVPLVPFLLEGVALVPEMNGDDNIHPNAAGAKRIAATVWPYLDGLIRQLPARAA